MGIGEWETGGAVVEHAVSPHRDGMATGASRSAGGEVGGHMVGHIAAKRLRLVPIGRMAGHAIGRTQRVVVVDVAGGAGRWCG